RDRAPFYLTENTIQRAFSLAEQRGKFQVDAVSPVTAAADITVPVLLIHGALDRETPPEHSQRVFNALQGPKRLILVPDAGHNQSLSGSVWSDIEEWIDSALQQSTPRGGNRIKTDRAMPAYVQAVRHR
ncbi:MAG: prolyl oligopeptidase family serine peptidase, partial [Planctomycetes bacterium]|nr:prolyl oligopeptidase family serine peptidase [Planctomycetota bacterium]